MANDWIGKAESIYSPPRVAERLDEYYFYRSMDLPQQGFISGEWDLRAGIERYLGHVQFLGKRVLDVGTAIGFLAFWMDRQRAEVIGFDLSEGYSRDRIPYGIDPEDDASWKAHISKINNSFWFTHTLLYSKVQMVYGTVYDIPEALGPVDVVTFGSILLHLRDPFLALQSALRITTETVEVAETLSLRAIPPTLLSLFKTFVMFLPNARRNFSCDTWWMLPSQTVVEFLRILGYKSTRVNYPIQRCCGVLSHRAPMYTVVGRRTSQPKV